MDRIPVPTIEEAPPASRPLLKGILHSSPTGKSLNMQAQMACSPTVLASYVSLRQATEEQGTIEPKYRSAIMASAASAMGIAYVEAITTMLVQRAGYLPEEVSNLRAGLGSGDEKLDSLLAVVASAAANVGAVDDAIWQSAMDSGWSAEQVTESFAYLGIVIYAAYFVRFAGTELDLPVSVDAR
jgi:hypothetical protein